MNVNKIRTIVCTLLLVGLLCRYSRAQNSGRPNKVEEEYHLEEGSGEENEAHIKYYGEKLEEYEEGSGEVKEKEDDDEFQRQLRIENEYVLFGRRPDEENEEDISASGEEKEEEDEAQIYDEFHNKLRIAHKQHQFERQHDEENEESDEDISASEEEKEEDESNAEFQRRLHTHIFHPHYPFNGRQDDRNEVTQRGTPVTCNDTSPWPINNNRNLTFPSTRTGQWVTSRELCLDDNNNPIVRFCDANGQWQDPIGNCSERDIKKSTNMLHVIFTNRSTNATEALEMVKNISENSGELGDDEFQRQPRIENEYVLFGRRPDEENEEDISGSGEEKEEEDEAEIYDEFHSKLRIAHKQHQFGRQHDEENEESEEDISASEKEKEEDESNAEFQRRLHTHIFHPHYPFHGRQDDRNEATQRGTPVTCNDTSPWFINNNRNLTFPSTRTGQWVTSRELCLDDNNNPIVRFCDANGQWQDPIGNCSERDIKKSTNMLHAILTNRSTNATEALEMVKNISENSGELTSADISLIANILDTRAIDHENSELFVNTVNNLMAAKKEELVSAQKLLNATDKVLDSLDQVLMNAGNINLTEEKLLVRTVHTSNQLRGAMIKTKVKNNDFASFETEYLYDENYEKKLGEENFEIAFLVPPNVAHPQERYIITLFQDDSLFKQETTSPNLGSWIFSVLVSNSGQGFTPATIRIYFKEFQDHLHQECQHWKYGTENNIPIKGNWSFDTNATKFKDHFYICEFNHTTHFGMLVSETAPSSTVLDIITIFGCALSVMGIAMIFIMALAFKRWRNKTNSKIILNVTICLLLLIILFFISGKIEKGHACIITGITLHYIVLTKFCWALTVSYSSYRRFYMVFHDYIENVLLKYCAFSWGLPIIIVTIVAAIDIQTYDKTGENSTQMCYPKGIYLKLGVCLPMGIILFANLIVYILITKKLTTNDYELRKHVVKKSCGIQKSLLLLFFMMGLTWIFGLLVVFTDQEIFLYAFCSTATLHGLAIFVFYVLDSPEMKMEVKKQMEKLRKGKDPERKCNIGSEEMSTLTTRSQSKENI